MNPSPMLLDAAIMLALNTGDYDQTQQAIKILDHNSGFYEGVRATAIETAARIIAKELARYQQMRPRTALELSEANDKLNDELAEMKSAEVVARMELDQKREDSEFALAKLATAERERDEADRRIRELEAALAAAQTARDATCIKLAGELRQTRADNAALRAAMADCAGWMAAQIAVQRSRVWKVEIYPTGAWKELVRCEEQARAALGKEQHT